MLNSWFGADRLQISTLTNAPINFKGSNEISVATKSYGSNIARFQLPETVQITLYDDGICLASGPFRPFIDPLTLTFVQDILDGYYPSEFKQSYPDGVLIEFIDKRDVSFLESHRQATKSFNGSGYLLGSCQQGKPSSNPLYESSIKRQIVPVKE
ncbi:unnamed protein product [Protopolystoma xenopodis]|uniref:UBX domain-containing protein 11 n=1 Tax=Protopolystoma xenopodis TaxID=117903 RepID=A0A3S5AB18_9PLAT|nr:unnamed protein product [Protopolystoma xenopodis]